MTSSTTSKSAREEVQDLLVAALSEQDHWTAPYGILPGLHRFKNRPGAARIITFGVARTLDATIWIWSPTRITIDGRGALAYRVAGEFDSPEAVIEHLANVYGKE